MSDTRQTMDPVAILRELEELCRHSAAGLERKTDAGSEWSGITFRIGDDLLVSQLGEVVEILEYPVLSKMPLTRSWVCGIANVRGSLLPVIDLGAYLNGNPSAVNSRTRVLVIDHNGLYTGLVVDEVLGIRHFTDDEYSGSDPGAAECLRPYLQNGFLHGDQIWNIFNLHALTQAPEFLQAAV
jgi:twitching motility protein PilI